MGQRIAIGVVLLVTWTASGQTAGATSNDAGGAATGPAQTHRKGGASSGEWSIGPKLLLQTDWRQDEANRNSSGLGLGIEGPLAVFGGLAIGLELGVDVLFREGKVVLANDLVLRVTLETHTAIPPFFGVGPVVLLDVGSTSEVFVGGTVTAGVILHATPRWGLILEGAYRLVGGHEFEQQLAISMGPVFFL